MSVETFKHLIAELDPDAVMSDERVYEMVFENEDMSGRVMLANDDRTLLADIYVENVAGYIGSVRNMLVRALMGINDAAVRNSDFSVNIDSRQLLVVTGRRKLEGLTDLDLADAVAFWLEQAGRVRQLARATSLQDGELTFEFASGQ